MGGKIKKSEVVVKHWLDSAEQNYMTMKHMLESKDYSWALFIGHLVIEKSLKALYVSRLQKHAIFTHDLLRLATKTGVELQRNMWSGLMKLQHLISMPGMITTRTNFIIYVPKNLLTHGLIGLKP